MRSSLTPSRKLKDPTSSLRQDILALSVWTPQPILMVKTSHEELWETHPSLEQWGVLVVAVVLVVVVSVGVSSWLPSGHTLPIVEDWRTLQPLPDVPSSLSLSLSLINTITHQTPHSLITSQLLDTRFGLPHSHYDNLGKFFTETYQHTILSKTFLLPSTLKSFL